MSHQDPTPAIRHDGWTAERQALFLELLAARGNVRAACLGVGLSREAAYRLRRRDARFARGWGAALVLARESVAEVFADRAIDGIEEEIWYRGELVGTKRKHDARLLLAHMARLDKLADDNPAAARDAARFDEILGCIAGEEVPEALQGEDPDLPPERSEAMLRAADAARERIHDEWVEKLGLTEELTLDDAQSAAFEAEAEAAAQAACLAAAALWDEWQARACERVDALVESRAGRCAEAAAGSLGTVSNVSTSPDWQEPSANFD